MKTIYYFSGTGNTLYVGKYLKENCSYNLVNISAVKDEKVIYCLHLHSYFLLFSFSIPYVVIDNKIRKFNWMNHTFLFFIITYWTA